MTPSHDGSDEFGDAPPEFVLAWLNADAGTELSKPISDWLASAPENERTLKHFERIWRLGQTPAPPDGWPEIRSRIDRLQAKPRLSALAPGRRRRSIVPFAIAATVFLAIGLATFSPRLRKNTAPTEEHIVITVPAGATRTVSLAAGVVVRLNAVSTISYSAARGRVQEVHLEGEGYFQIPHDPARIFRVHTEAGTVSDLGTDFNVNVRSGRVAVTVVEGAAQLEAAGEKVSVHAGQTSSAANGAPPKKAHPANLPSEIAWTQGRLVFFHEPLATVAEALTRKYGVKFSVSDDLREVRLTAAMNSAASADAAAAVCAAVTARCESIGDGWLITGLPRQR